jgi:UDP-N-acetylmuramoyl-tripeptide--D-alanyl-D-alanine ligase
MNIDKLYSVFTQQPLICTDSRKSIQGAIFFALKGENFNGNRYALKAIQDGCRFAIIDEEEYKTDQNTILVENALETLQKLAQFHRKQLTIPIIGITGTNGKTTSKELINSVLSSELSCYATKGSLNNHIGVPLSLLEINAKHEIAIIEMGANHQKEIEFLCNIVKPTYGAITNIGTAHLEGFKDLDGVIKTKNELFQFIAKNKGHLFVNAEDELLLKLSNTIQKTTYGYKGNVSGKINTITPLLNINYKNSIIKSQLIGDFQFSNIMLAICIGDYFNISNDNMQKSIENYIPTNNRSQIIETKNNTLILDAYNANPSSMQVMLRSFSEQDYTNKMCILGDMLELGEYSEKEHQEIISLSKRLNLHCYFIGEEFQRVNNQAFKNRQDFEEQIQKETITGKTLLLKGSRGIGLEKLVEYL